MIGTYVLMRVLLCKIQCPSFICFCKPSPHIYASGSLKLEDTPPPPPPPQVSSVVDDGDDDDQFVDAQVEEVVDHVDGLLNEAREEEGKEEDCALEEGQSNGEILKSSLKKETLDSEDGERREKKKVQWVDLMGKELAEILKKKRSDMMAIEAVFALFCDQFSLVKAMVEGEEAVGLVALESIYIEVVVHIVVESAIAFLNQSTFASLRLYEVSRYGMVAFCNGFRIVKRIVFYDICFFDHLVNGSLALIQEALTVIIIFWSCAVSHFKHMVVLTFKSNLEHMQLEFALII
ncbi:hypothetical protein DY000_02050737 [Brassica cretica]|uniref:Uncharacterized protein n=1 Tax=Brassica cretica TaxID=69181 RepID=A0ABQ7EXX5_BRACR|nr:hypothetical protein DY000_02050737 [Brassica cretica]